MIDHEKFINDLPSDSEQILYTKKELRRCLISLRESFADQFSDGPYTTRIMQNIKGEITGRVSVMFSLGILNKNQVQECYNRML